MLLEVRRSGLFDEDLRGPVNLFTGAGFSRLATNSNGLPLPLGEELKDLIITRFKREDLIALDLQSVYTIITNERKDELDDFLVEIFSVAGGHEAYTPLRKLNISHLYSTNIDDLASKVFAPVQDQNSRVFHDVLQYGEPRDRESVIRFIPLHGSVKHDPRDFVFTSGQISSAFQADQQTWFVFQRELQIRPTIFLGYGMHDAGVLQALHNASLKSSNRWILVRPNQGAIESLYESLGFHVIVGEIADFLEYLDRRSPTATTVQGRPLLGRVPSRNEIAQRPARNFFLGAEPEWSDAYSPQITKRRANDRVLDLILQGKNAAIIGLPLSGKSTILKQVAVDLSATRSCIYFDHLTIETAREIEAEHHNSTTKPIVLLDQFIDSRDAFNYLASSGGFKFIIAESSMFFDAINPRSLKTSLVTVSCTEVDRADFQRIVTSLPDDVRRAQVYADEGAATTESFGLFEGLVRHVYDDELKQRFRASLRSFEQRDQDAFDVYIMACYINMCRTLVSYDMIHLFTGSRDYTQVYRIIERIKEFVAETENPLDVSQDHFSVRSSGLARIAIRQVAKSAFGRVFDRFHRSVSSRVIPDFPTFRRYAFDNDFVVRAYADVDLGKRFYERLFAQYDNAYDYQHGAVYLSKSHRYGLAFEWIDKALSLSGGRTFAIRNSHAVILFEANIGIFSSDPGNQTAWQGLRQSMSVLQSCIENDRYRRYHLLRFTDQATKIVKILDSTEAQQWLNFARERLTLAITDAKKVGSADSYNRAKFERLLRSVEKTFDELG